MISNYDHAYHIKEVKPTELGLAALVKAIEYTGQNIYGKYELYPITQYLEDRMTKHQRLQRRIETTGEIIHAIEYIKEHKLV